METFINKMRRLQGIRKMILIEEAWKAIAREGMANYIRYLFKTCLLYTSNDVHVFAVYVFVQPYDIGLVPVTELFHELLRQYGHCLLYTSRCV